MVDLEYYTNLYFSNGEDAPYKLSDENEVFIKPVLVKDYILYENSIDVFKLRKNDINDIRIIQMSYLQYLIEVVFPMDSLFEDKLRVLFSLCLGENNIGFARQKNKWNIILCNDENVITNFITASDFDDIMFLVLNQNDATYDNRTVNSEVREMVQEYYRIKYANVTQPSLEKRKAFVSSKTNKTFKELGQLSIREFELVYRACLDSELYLTTKITEASYKYEVKNPANYPLFEKDKDAFEEAFSDTTLLQNKGFKGASNIGLGLE